MKVSVIIPCYNVEAFINECIQSLEQQKHQDLEVICIDDGSSDQTLKHLREIKEATLLNLQVFAQENRGASNARNHGLKYAKGDYIQFLDADDLLTPEKLAHQLELAQSQGLPDVIIGSYRRETLQHEVVKLRQYDQSAAQHVWANLMRTDLGITSSNLFKASLFETGIRWNETLKSSQEYALMFQILQDHEQVLFDPKVNTIIRQRDSGSISQTNLDQKWERYVQLRVDIMNFLQTEKPEQVNNTLYSILFDAVRMLYPYNQALALGIFQSNFPKGFVPEVSGATGPSYIKMYKFFGFKFTERLRGALKGQKAS